MTSNVAPRLCSEFQAACGRGDFTAALKIQDKLSPLHQNLFVETSPAPVKYAMSLIGKCSETVRAFSVAGTIGSRTVSEHLPISDKARTAVREAMVHTRLIN